jgi:hypothetical protein
MKTFTDLHATTLGELGLAIGRFFGQQAFVNNISNYTMHAARNGVAEWFNLNTHKRLYDAYSNVPFIAKGRKVHVSCTPERRFEAMRNVSTHACNNSSHNAIKMQRGPVRVLSRAPHEFHDDDNFLPRSPAKKFRREQASIIVCV